MRIAKTSPSSDWWLVPLATAALRAFQTPPGRKVALVMAGGWPMEVDQYIARDPSRAVNDRRIPSGAELRESDWRRRHPGALCSGDATWDAHP